jgi:ferredoxin
MGKWRVEFERENCIGAGACVAANADFWSIDQDGKATLKSATYDEAKKRWVLELDDDAQLQKQRDAAGVCPVNVIHVIDPDGKQEI